MILAIDLGNTRTKVGLFRAGQLEQVWTPAMGEVESKVAEICSHFGNIKAVGWLSVADSKRDPQTWKLWQDLTFSPRLVGIHSPPQQRNCF